MRRAALLVLTFLTICGAISAARADCADEVRSAQGRLPQIKDEAKRKELQLLLDKAGQDAAAGRERFCQDALVRAQSLMR